MASGNIANNGELTLGANALTGITDISISGSVATAISDVMGQAHTVVHAGSQSSNVTANFEVAQADTTLLGNYARGTAGAVEVHLFGDTATYIEITSTNGTVTQLDLAGAENGIVAATVTIDLDDFTLGAAI